ncbi:hypothetical protein Vadar_016137 [Vaccinium darrowii]|uniref:Uncharacterized protein n=1 Tax=Vaccinium darrowii TaxID=229202 RepID=A0ACB7YVX4_9ERIC|nr:hypothetical protein Vadar_016137 [Vaccinium darrowii]
MVGKLSACGTMGLATTFCLTDPCLGAKETVQEFQSEGVNVKMFTRYDISMAKMATEECDFLQPKDQNEMLKGSTIPSSAKSEAVTSKATLYSKLLLQKLCQTIGKKENIAALVSTSATFSEVTSVGMNTTWGEMMSKISINSNEQTPLKFRLNKLTSSMGKVVVSVAFLVHVVSYFIVRYTKDKNGNPEYNDSKHNADDILNSVVGIIANAVTILVDAIPGGLPAAWTFTLAYSMKRMMRDHAMVGKLSACGTMGLATTLCLTVPCLGAKETVQEF